MNSSTTAGTTLAKSSSVIALAKSIAIFNAVLSASTLGTKFSTAVCKSAKALSIAFWLLLLLANTSLAAANFSANTW